MSKRMTKSGMLKRATAEQQELRGKLISLGVPASLAEDLLPHVKSKAMLDALLAQYGEMPKSLGAGEMP